MQVYVEVSSPPLKCWKVGARAAATHNTIYDELLDDVIVIQQNNVQISPVFASKNNEVNYLNLEVFTFTLFSSRKSGSADGEDDIVDGIPFNAHDCRCSPDRQLLAAFLKSGELIIFNIHSNASRPFPVASLLIKYIKAIFWVDNRSLLILTETSIELQMVLLDKKSMKTLRRISTVVNSFCYSAKCRALIVRDHKRLNIIEGYHVNSLNLTKLNKLKLSDPPSPSNTLLSLGTMYNQLYSIIINSKRQELELYSFEENVFHHQCTLNLYDDKPYGVSIVDNLLVIHVLRCEISMVFDVRQFKITSVRGVCNSGPICPPAAMTYSPTLFYEDAKAGASSSSSSDFSTMQAPLLLEGNFTPIFYDGSRVVFLSSGKIFDKFNGKLFQLKLNISCTDNIKQQDVVNLCECLLSRKNSHQLILQLLRTMIAKGEQLKCIGLVFNAINSVYANAFRFRSLNKRKQSHVRQLSSSQMSSRRTISLGGHFEHSNSQDGCLGNISPLSTLERNLVNHSVSAPRQSASLYVSSSPSCVNNINFSDLDESPVSTSNAVQQIDWENQPPPEDSSATSSSPQTQTFDLKVRQEMQRQRCRSNIINEVFSIPFDASLTSSAAYISNSLDSSFSELFSTSSLNYEAFMLGGTTVGIQVISQMDMYKDVFFVLHDEKACSSKYFLAVLLEYIKSLALLKIEMEDFLHRFLIDLLIYSTPPDYHCLHQLLQYHIIEDRIPIAFQLLKFEEIYPPSFQLALDMLSRLKAYAEIAEVLISRNKVIQAVKVMLQYNVRSVSPKFVLEKAHSLNNLSTFFIVFRELQRFNVSCRGSPEFLEEDHCAEYEAIFENNFGPVSDNEAN